MHYPYVAVAGVVGLGEQVNGLDLAALRAFIGDHSQPGVIEQDEGGRFMLGAAGQRLSPEKRTIVAASVGRANLFMHSQAGIQGAGVEDVYQRLREYLKNAEHAQWLAERVELVLDGLTEQQIAWWGLSFHLSHEAAQAFAELLAVDVGPALGVIGTFSIKSAMVLAVVSVAGQILAQWIGAENGQAGVRVELLLWIVPTVDGG